MKTPARLVLVATLIVAGCSSRQQASKPTPASAVVRGQVTLTGTPKPDREVALPSQLKPMFPEGLKVRAFEVAADGGLADVFIQVLNPPTNSLPAPIDERLLTISNLVCQPRALAVQIGQPVRFRTAGQTPMLNLNAASTAGNAFNVALPRPGQDAVCVFAHPDLAVRLTDNVHPWLSAYVGVFSHPWFAVTDGQGRFELPPLPPGTYTVEAYHPRAGRSQSEVSVPGNLGLVQLSLAVPKPLAGQ